MLSQEGLSNDASGSVKVVKTAPSAGNDATTSTIDSGSATPGGGGEESLGIASSTHWNDLGDDPYRSRTGA